MNTFIWDIIFIFNIFAWITYSAKSNIIFWIWFPSLCLAIILTFILWYDNSKLQKFKDERLYEV